MVAPDVSVVLPVYNDGGFLPAAVESLVAQDCPGVEIIVVDDGSTDASAETAEQCLGDFSGGHVIRLRRSGIVKALNAGIAAARGRYIARMDADDICLPGRLRLQKEFLDAHPDTGLVSCLVSFGGSRQKARGYAAYVDWVNSIRSDSEIRLNRFIESPIPHPSVMFRRGLVGRYGGYRQGDFPEDYELWLRWLAAGVKMEKLPEHLLQWNDRPERLSRRSRRYSVRSFYRCKAQYLAGWLAANNPRYPKITILGAGRKTRQRAEMLGVHGIEIESYVDVDPRKAGRVCQGRPVFSDREPGRLAGAFMVSFVGSRGAREQIRRWLAEQRFCEGMDYIIAA